MRRVRMGNFLPQRSLLIYILAPESCDSYMIFYNNYKFVYLYLFGHINRSHVCDVCKVRRGLMGGARVQGIVC